MPLPDLVLWAWERPEDLRFINPRNTGVAYLAATVTLLPNGAVSIHSRRQPLRVPQNTPLIAVIRIESPARYLFPDPADLAATLDDISRSSGVRALQIDYDARASERNFYRAVLSNLRRRTSLPVGITALASWCGGDPWLAGQPISEAVPMFFRMGPGESKMMPVSAAGCRGSIGLSTDEQWPAHRPRGIGNAARVYVFNPHSWTQSDYETTVAQVAQWH